MHAAKAVEAGKVDNIDAREQSSASKGMGPRLALRESKLREMGAAERASWAEEARLNAILGSCKLSMKSWRSGVRCYISFISLCHFWPISLRMHMNLCLAAGTLRPNATNYFPPLLDDLLAWSSLFRSHGTFCNYLSYVRTACVVANAPTEVNSYQAGLIGEPLLFISMYARSLIT